MNVQQGCSQDFLRGGGDPLAKLIFYWSIVTGDGFVASSIFTGVNYWGGGARPPSAPPGNPGRNRTGNNKMVTSPMLFKVDRLA